MQYHTVPKNNLHDNANILENELNACTKLPIRIRNSVQLRRMTIIKDDLIQNVEIIICSGLGLEEVMS